VRGLGVFWGAVVVVLAAAAAHADSLAAQLVHGPLVRVTWDQAGRFDAAVAIVDVDAPADVLWDVLLDYDQYRFFQPRVERAAPTLGKDGNVLVDWKIDTPLISTAYTNLMTKDDGARLLKARQVKGDLRGSDWDWKIVPLGPGRCRMFHTARMRNFAALVNTLDDDQQTLTVGIATASVMSTMRAFKTRAEQLHKRRLAAQPPLSPPPSPPPSP
jgi:ribosome-associated toxin RatA of RatAB toxin-antitoxin module